MLRDRAGGTQGDGFRPSSEANLSAEPLSGLDQYARDRNPESKGGTKKLNSVLRCVRTDRPWGQNTSLEREGRGKGGKRKVKNKLKGNHVSRRGNEQANTINKKNPNGLPNST